MRGYHESVTEDTHGDQAPGREQVKRAWKDTSGILLPTILPLTPIARIFSDLFCQHFVLSFGGKKNELARDENSSETNRFACWQNQTMWLCPLRLEGLDGFFRGLSVRACCCGMIEGIHSLMILRIGERDGTSPKDDYMNMRKFWS